MTICSGLGSSASLSSFVGLIVAAGTLSFAPAAFAADTKTTETTTTKTTKVTPAKDAAAKPAKDAAGTKTTKPSKGDAKVDAGIVKVKIKTSMGDFALELNKEKAPKTVENFVSYANAGFYDGTIFHRVINGFMVQGGGMDEKMNEKKTNAPIENESKNGLTNDRGTVAMARTSDPNSATAQFFVNLVSNDFLNPNPRNPAGYAVFGKVSEGMDVVDKIAQVKTGMKPPHSDVPLEPVKIVKVEIVK